MSVDLGSDLELGIDIAGDTKEPVAVLEDALTLYRAEETVKNGGNLYAMATALDRAGRFDPAVDALADLMPILKKVKGSPAQKAKLFAVLKSLG